jgi:hypothetical protein
MSKNVHTDFPLGKKRSKNNGRKDVSRLWLFATLRAKGGSYELKHEGTTNSPSPNGERANRPDEVAMGV